jgi:hypothetical protein
VEEDKNAIFVHKKKKKNWHGVVPLLKGMLLWCIPERLIMLFTYTSNTHLMENISCIFYSMRYYFHWFAYKNTQDR